MKYSAAFSIELGETVTADEAFSYYHQGLISKNDEFLCNTDGCDAKLLCANIDKLPDLRKREPYFRTMGELESHDRECCPFHPNYDDGTFKRSKGDRVYELSYKRSSSPIVFLEEQPIREHVLNPDRPIIGAEISKKTVGVFGSGKRTSPNLSRHFRLRPLVLKFLRFSEEDRIRQIVRIGQRDVPMDELFFSLNRSRWLPCDNKLVFCGMGYIDSMVDKNGHGKYKLKFHYSQWMEGVRLRPTVFVPTYLIERYDECNLFRKIITKSLLTEKKRVDIYVYGRPVLRGDGEFLNVDFDSLNHIYFFPRNYADEE